MSDTEQTEKMSAEEIRARLLSSANIGPLVECLREHATATTIASVLDGAFTWKDTSQGFQYWSAVVTELVNQQGPVWVLKDEDIDFVTEIITDMGESDAIPKDYKSLFYSLEAKGRAESEELELIRTDNKELSELLQDFDDDHVAG